MSFSFESTRVQQPLTAPTSDNAGSTYRVAHRRQNNDGQHSLWREGANTDLPATITPETYGDTDSLLKDEFVMSDDGGVTWRIVNSVANHTGALLISAFDTAWPVTTDSDNQQSFIPSAALGTFSASESPSRDFYLVNQGSSISTLSFNIIDTITELVASQYSGQVQLALNGVFFQAGNGNPTTTFDRTLIWQTPPQSRNAFQVAFPANAYIRFTLTLVNFPQGGIQSSSVDFGLEFVGNATQFPIGLDHVWLQGARLIDDQAGFGVDLISSSTTNNIDVAPFAVNILGTAYYQAATLSYFQTPSGTVNYRLQATSEYTTAIVESSEALPSNSVNLVTFDFDGTTISNIVYVAPIRTVDYGKLEDATIARGRFITINSSGEPVVATSSSEIIGVSLFTNSGYYTRSGLVWLESSAAISVGDFLEPNPQGLAVTAASGPATALMAASAANQYILADFRAASGSSGGSGPTSLDDLTDVDLSTPPTNGQIIQFNATSGNFEPADNVGGASALGDLTDVDTTTIPPSDGQSLLWDNANSLWKPASFPNANTVNIFAAEVIQEAFMPAGLNSISIPITNAASYSKIEIEFSLRSTELIGRQFPLLSFNSDTINSNYDRHVITGLSSAVSAAATANTRALIAVPGSQAPTNTFSVARAIIVNPGASKFKLIELYSLQAYDGTNEITRIGSIIWKNTAPITQFTLDAAAGNFVVNSFYSARGYKTFAVNTGGGVLPFLATQPPINADPSPAMANSTYLLNSAVGSFNVTLPAGTNGDRIVFADHAGTSQTAPTGLGLNPVTIIPNGLETIQGASNLILNTDNQSVELVFYGTRWTIVGT